MTCHLMSKKAFLNTGEIVKMETPLERVLSGIVGYGQGQVKRSAVSDNCATFGAVRTPQNPSTLHPMGTVSPPVISNSSVFYLDAFQ